MTNIIASYHSCFSSYSSKSVLPYNMIMLNVNSDVINLGIWGYIKKETFKELPNHTVYCS